MFVRPPPDEDTKSPSSSCAAVPLPHPRAEELVPDEGASRVSTDSDLDLESADDDDDYRTTFSELLVRKLVAVERAQHQHALREEKGPQCAPPHLFALSDDSYWAKMRRVSQWRQSTRQSETSSNYSPPASSRKRRLSDASRPPSPKRIHLAALSPAPPRSPFFAFAQTYPLDAAPHAVPGPDAYPRAYDLRVECDVQPYAAKNTPHVCSACDTTFASRQRLSWHGRGSLTPDACRAAVTYILE